MKDQAAKTQVKNILIVHGWSLNPSLKQNWQPLIKLLSLSKTKVKYLAVPGFESKLEKSWSLDDYAHWLLEEIKQHPNCVVIGHSFGGQIATRAAAKKPKNLLGLVLIGPSGIIDKSLCKQLKRKVFKNLAQIKSYLPRKLHQPLQKILYKTAREQDYYQASPLLKSTMTQVLQDEIIHDLPQIQVPTLIIWGTDDSYTPYKNSQVFDQQIKNSKLATLPGERHRPYFTQPQKINNLIQNFFQHDL